MKDKKGGKKKKEIARRRCNLEISVRRGIGSGEGTDNERGTEMRRSGGFSVASGCLRVLGDRGRV